MTLREAIKLLTDYQQWRLGNDDFPMQIPSEITKALDILLNHSVSTLELPQQEISYTEKEVRAAIDMARCRAEHIFWYNDEEIIQSLKQTKQ